MDPSQVALRPSIVPHEAFLLALKPYVYLPVAYAVIPALAASAAIAAFPVRLFAALVVTVLLFFNCRPTKYSEAFLLSARTAQINP